MGHAHRHHKSPRRLEVRLPHTLLGEAWQSQPTSSSLGCAHHTQGTSGLQGCLWVGCTGGGEEEPTAGAWCAVRATRTLPPFLVPWVIHPGHSRPSWPQLNTSTEVVNKLTQEGDVLRWCGNADSHHVGLRTIYVCAKENATQEYKAFKRATNRRFTNGLYLCRVHPQHQPALFKRDTRDTRNPRFL